MRALAMASRLAVRDFFYERLMSLCAVLSLASILAPLLVLAGVRYGVISALRQRLLQDPTILTVLPQGSGGGYGLDWINALKDSPGVAFVIPRTRDIAAVIVLERPGDETNRMVATSMEPTAAGDPLLARHGVPEPAGDQVVLSATTARKLNVTAGDRIMGRLGRKLASGKLESVSLPLTVVAILPLDAEPKDVAFLALDLLEDAERYRDGIAVPGRGFTGDPPPEGVRQYGGFRLYAKDLDSVAVVRDSLVGQGVEVETKAWDIEMVKGLDRALTLILTVIVVSAGAGFVASSASSTLAAVRRKDKYLAMIRLLGFPSAAIRAYPMVQSLLTALLGSLLAGTAYVALGLSLDMLFSQVLQAKVACRLPAGHLVAAFCIVLLLSLLSSIQASLRAARIDPSEVLREL